MFLKYQIFVNEYHQYKIIEIQPTYRYNAEGGGFTRGVDPREAFRISGEIAASNSHYQCFSVEIVSVLLFCGLIRLFDNVS